MKNFSEILANDQIFYWCNSSGECKLPGDDPIHVVDLAELPPTIQRIYSKFQSDAWDVNVYTVTMGGRAGMLISAEFPYSNGGFLGGEAIPEPVMHFVTYMLAEKAERRFRDVSPAVEVYYGEETAPYGDEIVFFLPYAVLSDGYGGLKSRDWFVEVCRLARDLAYTDADSLLGKAIDIRTEFVDAPETQG